MARRKRAGSDSLKPEPSSRRRSGRISLTPKKSKYFDDGTSEDDNAEFADGFEDGNEEESEETEDPLTEGDSPQKKGRGRPSVKRNSSAAAKLDAAATAAAAAAASKKKGGAKRAKAVKDETEDEDEYRVDEDEEDDEEEEQEESDDDDDRPRKVTIIPLEELRPEGGVEYEDTKLHKNTLLFLKDLKQNNRRPWLKSHDGEYRRALKDWNTFVETFIPRVSETDPTVPELPVKDVIFRIHRDVRFSKDPTPYKPNFSVAFSRTGRKGPYAAYYVHVEPGGGCFLGGGLWCPPADQLRLLRASIDERPGRWRRVLGEERFKRVFLDRRMPKGKKKGAKKNGDGGENEEAAVMAFTKGNERNALKKKPKDYPADHRDIELLKLKSFTVAAKLEDDAFTRDDIQDKLVEIMEAMVPYITFLNRIVMPDPGDDDSSEEEDDEMSGNNQNGHMDEDDESDRS